MLKFKDYKYERPDLSKLTEQFNELLEKFNESKNFEEQNAVMKEINKVRNYVDTMATLVNIRHSIDTEDEFYAKENDFIDENMPRIENLVSKFYKELVNSKFRNELEEAWGKQVFNLAELQLQTFSEEIIDDLIRENKLVTEYDKLVASAKLNFEGEIRNLSQMRPFMESKDRDIRKKASETMIGFFQENEKEFDRIYDELVKVRDKMEIGRASCRERV